MARSAAGLLRETLSSNGNDVGSTLSDALHESGKAGSGSSLAASASSPTYWPTLRPEFPITTGESFENDAFRSRIRPPNAPHEAFEGISIDQFFHGETQSKASPFVEDQLLDKGKKAIYGTDQGDVSPHSYDADFASAWRSTNVEKHSRGNEIQSLTDGEEVVKLLSDPSFQPEIWTEDSEDSYTITEEEMQISQWFMGKVHEEPSQRERLQKSVAAARSGQAFQDFASIFDEIESYHEEVWGYIRPLVEAARQEQRVAEPTATQDGPAVHRLRMIVAHLEAPALPSAVKHLSEG